MDTENWEAEDTPVRDTEATGNGSDSGTDASLFGELKQRRNELEPFGKTKVLEVPGYNGKLAVEYRYIGSEVAEIISKKIQRETRGVGGRGLTLLSSTDTLIEACNRVLIRNGINEEWRPMSPEPVTFGNRHKEDHTLPQKLDYDADSPREVVIGLFGSEHAVIQQNVMLSRWLGDVTREVEEEFL